MLIHKGFKFRAYPTEPHKPVLASWFGCRRFIYNLGRDQRRIFGRKGRSISYQDQANDLKELRAELPWLAECPSQILQQGLVDLNKAHERFFDGLAAYPKRQKKYENDSVRFPELVQRKTVKRKTPDGMMEAVLDENGEAVWKAHTLIEIGPDWIDLPKLGKLRIVRHRELEGTPKSVTISREGEFYYVSITCVVEIPDPVVNLALPTGGLDFGVRQDWTRSDGSHFDVPRPSRGERRRRLALEHGIGRQVEMRKALGHAKPSHRELKRRQALRALDGRLTRRAHDALHKFTTSEVKAHSLLGIEGLKVKAITASAAGTLEEPGRNVAAKAALNRELLHGRPGMTRRLLQYKGEWKGCRVVAVPPAHTSQYCSACERHPKDDPATAHLSHGRDGALFHCLLCGFECDADVNAARNIEREARRIAVKEDAEATKAKPRRKAVRERRKGSARFKRQANVPTAGGPPVAVRGGDREAGPVNRDVDLSVKRQERSPALQGGE